MVENWDENLFFIQIKTKLQIGAKTVVGDVIGKVSDSLVYKKRSLYIWLSILIFYYISFIYYFIFIYTVLYYYRVLNIEKSMFVEILYEKKIYICTCK